MALIVRNTFLDFATEEASVSDRRCHSLPRKWKQAPSRSLSDDRSPISPDASTRASLRSDFSFYNEEDLCTSSSDTTPEAEDCAACGWCLSTELAKISFCLTKRPCEPEDIVEANDRLVSDQDTSTGSIDKDTSACSDAFENQESEIESDGCTRAEFVFNAEVERTKLKRETSAAQPLPSDPRTDAVANAVHLALASCGRAQHVNIGSGHDGTSSVLISAEVENGPRAFSRSYDIVRVAKNELDAVVARLKTVKLLSARVQKEDFGYSLRSSIAFVPEGVGDRMCWDMFRQGYCERGQQCRWQHPRNSQFDIRKIKVSVRHSEEASDVSSEEQLRFRSSAVKSHRRR